MTKKIITVFKELGFTLQKFEEDVYIFNYEGVKFVYRKDSDDERFLQIGMPLEQCDDTTDKHKLANEMNIRLKYVKTFVFKDNLWVIYERMVKTDEDMASVVKNIVVCLAESMHFYLDLMKCDTKASDEIN